MDHAFTANIRTPAILGPDPVQIHSRERGPPPIARWDSLLTLEFPGRPTSVKNVEITRNDLAVTVFSAGDSTVAKPPTEPYAGWGNLLPLFFGRGMAIANHAESGLTLNTFRIQRRLEKVLSGVKALGPDASKQAFVHYQAHTFPGQDKALEDDTHHNAYGGWQLAKCVVEGIRRPCRPITTWDAPLRSRPA